MIINLKIVRVNSDYCDYLRKYDNKVAYNKNEKVLRPFIGILFQIDTCEYFAPLSSPKPKHKNMKNTVDFFKIKDGELGAVNFNNMIPVNESNYSLVDLNKETLTIAELKYQKLLTRILTGLWICRSQRGKVGKRNAAEGLSIAVRETCALHHIKGRNRHGIPDRIKRF